MATVNNNNNDTIKTLFGLFSVTYIKESEGESKRKRKGGIEMEREKSTGAF